MLPQLAKLKGIALDLLFPRWCLGCGREGSFLCPSCRSSLTALEPPFCPRCGRPRSSGGLCPACAGLPPAIDGVRAPYVFDGVLRRAIHQFKYENLKALAEPLGELLAEYYRTCPLSADLLVPVPLHPKRLKERGYNQAELLAEVLGKAAGLPVNTGCLFRERYSLPQARTASVTERKENVSRVFVCRGTAVRAHQVMLIDDVATSGATLNAAAAVLKEAGAASVRGLVIAREI
ncbi:MAG: ComF family protein [Chloroflexota bacterium]